MSFKELSNLPKISTLKNTKIAKCYTRNTKVDCTIVDVIGTDNIEAPANFSSNSSEDNMITFTWDHVNPSLVDHYEMVLEHTDQTGEQTVLSVERNRFSLTLPSAPKSTYIATLTAISVCGQRSVEGTYRMMLQRG